MATNLAIDDALINDAVKVGHHPSKKAAVTAALKEYIQRHKQMEIIALFGTLSFDAKYDYKKQRHKDKDKDKDRDRDKDKDRDKK